MDEPITFRASFPPIQSAIKVDGAGGGMRIQLDVPECEMPQAVKLLAWRQVVLRVTVEAEMVKNTKEQHDKGSNAGKLETRSKRQSKWQTTKE